MERNKLTGFFSMSRITRYAGYDLKMITGMTNTDYFIYDEIFRKVEQTIYYENIIKGIENSITEIMKENDVDCDIYFYWDGDGKMCSTFNLFDILQMPEHIYNNVYVYRDETKSIHPIKWTE